MPGSLTGTGGSTPDRAPAPTTPAAGVHTSAAGLPGSPSGTRHPGSTRATPNRPISYRPSPALPRADLPRSILRRSTLRRSILPRADLRRSILPRADLPTANLSRSSRPRAHLPWSTPAPRPIPSRAVPTRATRSAARAPGLPIRTCSTSPGNATGTRRRAGHRSAAPGRRMPRRPPATPHPAMVRATVPPDAIRATPVRHTTLVRGSADATPTTRLPRSHPPTSR
ncbi:pentapeptide repeat-containing protein [Pseudonocardia sp. N23]|uniref:pentapeptide repeat-containing protein n=1 Tax=Pseudonocardia sp. N23 TaxID=1987376 RepID=UPI0035B632A9